MSHVNDVDPDQTPPDLSLHHLPVPLIQDARHKGVNIDDNLKILIDVFVVISKEEPI